MPLHPIPVVRLVREEHVNPGCWLTRLGAVHIHELHTPAARCTRARARARAVVPFKAPDQMNELKLQDVRACSVAVQAQYLDRGCHGVR